MPKRRTPRGRGVSTADTGGNGGTGGNANLVAYLNAQYADGSGAGQFVFLRLKPDASVTVEGERFRLATADSAAAEALRPTLNYTAAVPEPTTLALAGFAGLGLLARRHRA
jgi:hypothetical protein